MKKIIASFLVMSLLMLSIGSVVAMKQNPSADNGLNHRGRASQLYLYEKNPVTWKIIGDGAWGKMTFFNTENGKFVFNGHGLEPNTGYTLISYEEPEDQDYWSTHSIIELGSVMSNDEGNVHIMGELRLIINEYAGDAEGDYQNEQGAKIWLVLSDHINDDGTQMTAWNPTEYLFEYDLINPESSSDTVYHGNGIYSTTHVVREDYAKPDKPGKPQKPKETKGPACYKLRGVQWANTPDYVAQSQELLGTATTSIGIWNASTGFDLLGTGNIDVAAKFDVFNADGDLVMDEKNSYSMGDYPVSGVIAVTRTWWNTYTNEIVEYDIMFDTDFAWGDAEASTTAVMDLQNIATHEIGHAFGLLDLYNRPCSKQTMFGYSGYGEISKRSLEYGDIAGIQALYGTPTA